jgi:Arm DNA-binding domain
MANVKPVTKDGKVTGYERITDGPLDPATGRRKQVRRRFKTSREAKAALVKFENERNGGDYSDGGFVAADETGAPMRNRPAPPDRAADDAHRRGAHGAAVRRAAQHADLPARRGRAGRGRQRVGRAPPGRRHADGRSTGFHWSRQVRCAWLLIHLRLLRCRHELHSPSSCMWHGAIAGLLCARIPTEPTELVTSRPGWTTPGELGTMNAGGMTPAE